MNEGEVVLTPLPQADGQVKNRPAIVLRTMPPERHRRLVQRLSNHLVGGRKAV